MELVKVAEREEADMCASKMLSYKNTNIIDSTGILMFKDGGAIDRETGIPDNDHDQVEEVFGPCAGAALYKREMFDEVGLFGADYFAYFEDVDLAWRARLAGCKCFFVPSAILYHIKAGSASSPFVLYHRERNRIWSIAKNMSLMSIICNLHWIIAKWVVLRVWFHRKNIKELARADIGALKGLPRMLKKRREIQKLRVVPDSDIRKWMISPIEHWRIKRRMAK